LLPASSNVIVSNLVQIPFLIFTLDRFAFAVYDSILCNYAVFWRIHLNDLEFHLSHTTTNSKKIALSDGSVSLTEVRGEENIKKGAGEAFDGIGNREDSNALGLGVD
jgi:hypothetical protein